MNKFTQGPWLVQKEDEEQTIINSPEGAICRVYQALSYEANARLIAAAPELLEALENIIQFYSDNIQNMPVAFQTFVDLSQQAIKKAKGE